MRISGWRRHRTVAIQLAAGGVVLAVVAGLSMRMSSASDLMVHVDQPPPTALTDALARTEARLFAASEGQCVTARDLEPAIRQDLEDLGLSAAWTISRSPGVADESCVAYGASGPRQVVTLVAALSTRTKEALTAIAEVSYRQCFGRDEAVAAVTAVLRANGLTDWEIRTDGPIAAPLDRVGQVTAHVRSGCFIYSGTGFTGEGRRLVYVVGPP